MISIEPSYLAGAFALSLGAIATALITFGENREFKKNIEKKVDGNFRLLTDEMAKHEDRDNERQMEVLERIGRAEQNLLESYKNR